MLLYNYVLGSFRQESIMEQEKGRARSKESQFYGTCALNITANPLSLTTSSHLQRRVARR